MGYFGALAILFVTGCGFSLATFRDENLRKNRIMHFTGLALFLCLGSFAGSKMEIRSLPDAVIAVPALALASVPWSLFFAYWVVEFVVNLARSAVGLNNLRIAPGYSPAEAALIRKDFDEAERLYRKLIDDFPDKPEPCRRLAELLLSRNRQAEAITCFQEAEKREPDPGIKIMHCFSVADILADHIGDMRGAIAVIEKFAAQYPDSSIHDYAKERIAAMRAKLQTPGKDTP